ncbi:MAG: hypothetical protein ACYDGR_09475 [Candidatus Dormibacteria bacterium]
MANKARLGARARLGALTLLVLAGAALGTAPAAATVVPGPPLPPQPGTSSPDCATPVQAPGAWSLVSDRYQATRTSIPDYGSLSEGPIPQYQVAGDPWMPCRLYRAVGTQSLERSTDSGGTWTRVFSDQARQDYGGGVTCGLLPPPCPTQSRQFNTAALLVPAPGKVTLAEDGNGDALVSSSDGGGHWKLAGGLDGQAVRDVVSPPDNQRAAYAIVDAASALQANDQVGGNTGALNIEQGASVYATQDGGANWTLTALPAGAADWAGYTPRLEAVAVDPVEPQNAWELYQSANSTTWDVFATTNYGRTFTLASTLQVGGPWTDRAQLVALRSAHHSLRLLMVGSFAGFASNVISSDDGGVTWAQRLVRTEEHPTIAVDPLNQDRVVYAGSFAGGIPGSGGTATPSVDVTYSEDGFDTGASITVPAVAKVGIPTDYTPLDAYEGLATGPAVLQADRFGSFFIATVVRCAYTGEPGCANSPGIRQMYWRFRPHLPAKVDAAAACGAACSLTAVTPMVELKHCPLPPTTNIGNGSLTFDGKDLLYTQAGEYGPARYQGIIHRIDAATCVQDSDVLVNFDPAFMQAHRNPKSADNCGAPSALTYCDPALHPPIDELTFDARRDALWVNVQLDQGDELFLTKIGPAPGVGPAIATAVNLFVGGCGPLLTYDFSTDSLWTCSGSAARNDQRPARLRTDGVATPTCMSSLGIGTGVRNNGTRGMATWLFAGPGRMFVQAEDDQTLYEYDSDHCSLVRTYVHRVFSEPSGEDEQMACDPVSLPGQTLIWLRDAQAQLVTAYSMSGTCPLPTTTSLGNLQPLAPMASLTICSSSLFRGKSVPDGIPVDFQVDGKQFGGSLTAGGNACATGTAPPTAGVHPVSATFTGNNQFLTSSDTGALTLQAPLTAVFSVPPALLPPQAGVLAPPAQGPNPPPTQSVSEVQVQGQVQAQGQTQTQTVSQPGLAAAEQRQPQLARQTARREQRRQNQQLQLQALSLLSSVGALSVALALGLRRNVSVAPNRFAGRPPS